MRKDIFEQKLGVVRDQIQHLLSSPGEQASLKEGLKEVAVSMEELKVIGEELRQQDEELKISETRYRHLFETAQGGILILDADTGQISDVNPFLVEMLGYSHEDVLGKKLWEIGAFKDIEASKAAFSELQNKGYVRYEDLPLETRDGRHIEVEFVSNVYLVDHKKVVRCNIRDITQRKQAEDQLGQKTHELGERVKELNCLYAYSKLIEKPDNCLPEIFQGLVDIIPSGWQYPEIACARLVLEDQIFKTANFMETIWKQSSPILVDGRHIGDLEVYYLEGKPEFEEGPFLKNERNLIDALASRLGETIKRKRAEEALQKAHDKLEERVKERAADLVSANKQLYQQIEERKRADKDLQIEQHKLKGILEAMNDGVYIVDLQYDIEYVNPVIEKEFGPVNGRKCYEYFHDRKEVCPWCKSPEVFAGKSVQWEWHSFKTGKTYELFDTPVPNAYGTISKLEIFHDITERKRVEEALRQSEMKYRIVADNTYDWEWWRDPKRIFIYVSPSCKRITHHETEEFIKDPDLLLKIIHPDDKPSFIRHQIEVEEKHASGEIEFRILRPDGSCRWLAHVCQPVFDEQGRFLGRRGSNRDITGRREAEKSLRESEERYRTLVETMNDGLGVADEKEVWTYVNDRFCKMLAYARDEIIGRPVHEWLDEANRKIFSEQLIKLRRGEQEPYEIAWIRKDGSTAYTLVSPKPVFEEPGQFQGSFAVITDITERKKTEESVRNALSEIKILKDRLETENIYFRQEITMKHQFGHIIGQSNAFKYVLYRAEQVAPTNATVLILGQTGTGKELIAAAIHQMSPRKDRPLITVNCAALPANLIESELFGREKGAFTGADARQIGRFEIANGSTICLDEIGELPLEVQAKLLRVIQHHEFERLGSSQTVKVDVRILATTNRNLEEEIRKGRFRKDLYYRLNVFPITVPPLRQRKEDIPMLVQAFVERFGRELGKQISSIPKETMKALQEYEWPGNIRELENVIERALILCPGPVFQMADKLGDSSLSCSPSDLRTLEETERDQILKALSETRWRINGKLGAAAILGLNPSTLRARMQKLGIRRPEAKISE